MPVRSAKAVWEGSLKDGAGTMELGSGAYRGAYSFGSRFQEESGTNPEELIGSALAGCFSMALSADLGRAGYEPDRIATSAEVHLEKLEEGNRITRILLRTEASIPEISPAAFETIAQSAKQGCPVSRALSAVEIQLEATLASG